MKKVAFGLFLIMTYFVALSQETYIGQDAQEIKYLVENGTRYNSNTSWDIRYQNGKIADVILCFYKEYLVDVGITADFCKHFIMENNRLAYVITQYETLTLSQLIEAYNKLPNYIKIGDKYYDNDYKNYSIIYLHDNGLATIEWTKTNLDDLPKDVRNKVDKESLKVNDDDVKNKSDNLVSGIGVSNSNDLEIYGTIYYNGKPTDNDFNLKNREVEYKPEIKSKCRENGIIIMKIEVDRNGVTKKAEYSKGTTNVNECILNIAKQVALGTKWSKAPNASALQIGYIKFSFNR